MSSGAKPSPEEEIVVDCGDTFYNHPKLSSFTLQPKDKLSINCMNSCAVKDDKFLYGSDNYPFESAVCISAYHSGAIKASGGKFAIEI